jgi:glycosyltransferase involved in cell wall biosynthesis
MATVEMDVVYHQTAQQKKTVPCNMKVLLINTYASKGGAAKATARLFSGLKALGTDVSMLAQNRESDDPEVIQSGGRIASCFNPLRPYIDFAISLPFVRKRLLFSTSMIPDGVVKTINQINPDIVHLNWIAGGMLRIESLARISKPVVWTLHDLWPFTGGCHNPLSCTRYREACGKCPLLHSSRENDLSRKVFERKRETYGQMKNLHIVTPSRWLADCVKSGPLLGDRPVTVIPNGLDTELFKPSENSEARRQFGMPDGRKTILFGGIRGVEYPLKGFHLLLDALQKTSRTDLDLVVFGSSGFHPKKILPLPTRFLGHIAEEKELALLYSAADAVAVPSYQEVFGQTASEALSCGIPVVAFRSTGLIDIVDHQLNGYLATPFDTADFAMGINQLTGDESIHRQRSQQARIKALEHFDMKKVAGSMNQLYHQVVSEIQ